VLNRNINFFCRFADFRQIAADVIKSFIEETTKVDSTGGQNEINQYRIKNK